VGYRVVKLHDHMVFSFSRYHCVMDGHTDLWPIVTKSLTSLACTVMVLIMHIVILIVCCSVLSKQ